MMRHHFWFLSGLFLVAACSSKSKESQPKKESQAGARDTAADTKKVAETAGPDQSAQPAEPPPPLPAAAGDHIGAHLLSKNLGSDKADAARALAITPSGELLLAGYFKGDRPFGADMKADGADAYLAKLSSKDASVVWAVQLGGPGDDVAEAVEVNSKGNALVVGSMADKLVIGDGALTSAGADDIFVACFSPEGRRLWAKRYGGLDIDAAQAVVADAQDNFLVAGMFRGEVKFDEQVLKSNGDSDIFLAKLSPDGKLLWVKQFGALGQDFGRDLSIDKDGNLILLAEISYEVGFGGPLLGTRGNRDIALVKLSPDGEHIWSVSHGDNYDDIAISVTTDPVGSIILTGSFEGKASFGGDTLSAAGRSDLLIAKYNGKGQHLWSLGFGSDDEEWGNSIASDSYGNSYVTGWFWKEVDFGGHKLKSKGKEDIFLLKVSPEGKVLWAKSFGNNNLDKGKAVSVDAAGQVYTAGTFHVSVNFGGQDLVPVVAKDAVVTAGDIYLAGFSP